jgi:hypothetical protein
VSQLTLASIPGFFDIADAALAAGQPVTDDSLLKISHNAKFGVVRSKAIFMGFYANGNVVPTPVDPDDGYAYARSECQFVWLPYSNRAPAAGFIPGQQLAPAQSSAQPGPLYNFPGPWDIDDATGAVSCRTTYWQGGTTEVVSNDGIMKVYALVCRSTINVSN